MAQLLPIILGAALSILSSLAAGELVARRIPLPRVVRFTIGAACCSLGVFALLALYLGFPWVYVAAGLGLCGCALRRPAAVTAPLPAIPWFFRIVLGTYAAMYFVFALAPEIQPDAAAYHLRIVAEYVRLHAFTSRDGFFDVLPQGLEMLFVPAFALGAHSAAKLLHFAFLLATVPLIREISRGLGFDDRTGLTAASLIFLAPVAGVAGTSAYTDLALLCNGCSMLYLLVRWSRERSRALLPIAALNAAFCYSVKPTFAWIAVAGFGFVLYRGRKPRPALAFIGFALFCVLPWVGRAFVLTGNPVAPFLTGIDLQLAQQFSAFRPSFSWRTALLDYTALGGNQGLVGPVFLLLPLSLLALRRRAGKWLLLTASVFLVPVLANTGTRFLLPAMAPAAIALASVFQGPAALLLVAIQAVGSAPPVIDIYDRRHEWHLAHIPFEAALRLTPEQEYLAESVPDFRAARMIARGTPPGTRILACASLPEAYIPRELLVYWQSAQARRFTDALHFAMMSQGTRARLLSWRWNEGRFRSVRLTALSELRIVEASPGPSSWQSFQPGQVFSLGPLRNASLLIWPGDQAVLRTEARVVPGAWLPIDAEADMSALNIDVRRDATAYVRRSGYRFIAIPAANDPFAEIGADMLRHESEWGVRRVGHSGSLWLFEIAAELK